jgi:glycogen(starch) synthase
MDVEPRRVIRLCSVFEPPAESLTGRGVRFDPIGGMQNHAASLTRALDGLGVVQDVITTRPPGAPARHGLGRRATVHRLGLPVPVMRQLYSVPAAALVDRLAARASVLHAHLGEDLAIVPIVMAAARRHRLPWVLTIHASLAHTMTGGGWRGALLRGVGGRLERVGSAHADGVITLTPRLARLLAAEGIPEERVHVIPSGVEVDGSHGGGNGRVPLPSTARRDGRLRVLFAGRLAEQKGVRYLVEATARMQTPGVEICVVGDGPQRNMLEDLAGRLGIEDRVSFLGFQPHDAIPSLMATADLLVLPSVYEELGSVLVEGMHAGLPIVASDTGGIADAVGDAAVLVPPRDARALARALDVVLSDPARRVELSAAARSRAVGYHWDALARRVLAVYRSALAAPRRARR